LVDEVISKILDEQIYLVLKNYAGQYPASVVQIPGIVEKCVVQSSTKGKGYNSLEVVAPDGMVRKRHLAMLIFLNQISEGGNIIFPQQNIKIRPKRGMILIFPDNWQFVYSIEPSKEELFWLSGHISNVTQEEKLNAMERVKVLPVSSNIKYNMV
jgi:hypothetical protein